MDDDDRVVQVSDSAVRNELAQLRQEHRDLDSAIEALQSQASPDNLQIQRLKKRKLLLKDRITALEDKLLPDIIA
ncbi:MAG: YdcH family protein [Propylenella sp.]